MKKIFTLLLCTAAATTAFAQSNGFYRVQNDNKENYMVMVDNQSSGVSSSGSVDLDAITMEKDLSKLYSHPGSVVYIKKVDGTKYDIESQGSSLSKLTGGALYPQLIKQSDGTYLIYGSYGGFTMYLGASDSKLRSAGKNDRYWNLLPIDFKNNFIGITPDLKTDDGNYWGTFYASFAFKLHSDGMEAYYVDGVNNSNFTLKKITSSTIPATMPVIIKCASSDPAKNMIEPVESGGSEPSDNNLNGVYFDNGAAKHVNRKEYSSSTMRVLGTSGGYLAFVKADSKYLTGGSYLPHNKCYLTVSSSAASTLTETTTLGINSVEAEPEVKEGTYTLTGQKIPDGVTPRPGIYIKNGKKVVIK